MAYYTINRTRVTLHFDYNPKLISLVKKLHGRKWNNDSKSWSVPGNVDNLIELKKIFDTYSFEKAEGSKSFEELFSSKNIFEVDSSLVKNLDLESIKNKLNPAFDLHQYQINGVKYGLSQKRILNGSQMGCISGDMEIQLRRAKRSFKFSLREVYLKFNGLAANDAHNWSKDFVTYCKCLDERRGVFIQNEIEQVLYKGEKETVKIVLESGKEIVLTSDHEVLSEEKGWVPASSLELGDKILTNGRIQHPDGYIYVSEQYNHPRADLNGRVAEHILIMEAHLGRNLKKGEVVHHKNRKRNDNRLVNLQLMSDSDHKKLHSKTNYKNLNNKNLILIPNAEKIISIEENGVTDVYDIVMKDPHRNFVANKVVVHNCGKTVMTIASVEIGDLFPCLVICPSNVKYHWEDEWNNYLPKNNRKISVIDSKTKSFDFDADVVIINYEMLGKAVENESGTAKIAKFKFDELKKIQWKSLAIDESHKVKNKKTNRSKLISKISKDIGYIFELTGTPVEKKPIEIVNQLVLLRQFDKHFGPWQDFVERYCDGFITDLGFWDTSGSSNSLELNQRLKEVCYYRVESEEVLKELPRYTTTHLKFDITNRDDYEEVEYNLYQFLKENRGQESAMNSLGNETLVRESVLRYLTQKGKLKETIAWIKDTLEATEENILVFGRFKEGLQTIAKEFDWPYVDGLTPPKEKHRLVKESRNSKKRGFVGNIKSIGTGTNGLQHNFSIILFLDVPNNPAVADQAIFRLVRPGQKNHVKAYYAVGADTIDVQDAQRLLVEGIVSDAINKGKITKERMKDALKVKDYLTNKYEDNGSGSDNASDQ